MGRGSDTGDTQPTLRQASEWRPAFTRFSGPMTAALGRIQAALAVTTTLTILPAQEDELRHAATIGTIHYSTLIEGNTLSTLEAERAARGELERRSKAQIELVNYVETLDWLDRQHEAGTISYDEAFLLDMHRRLMRGLGREGKDERFKPHHEGAFRDGEVVIPDELGNIVFTGPANEDVPGLVAAMFDYLNTRRQHPTDYPGGVLAGLAHHRLTEVHPFADGNGRLARTFAIAVLMREGLLPERIFSFERHYAENKDEYFAALRTVRPFQTDYTAWLEFFLVGLAEEYERVAERVRVINQVTASAQDRTRLTTTQEQVIAKLADYDSSSLRLSRELGIPTDTVTTALSQMRSLGIVERRNVGRGRIYQLVAAPRRRGGATPGPPKYWTDTRIKDELLKVIADRGDFPTLSQLESADPRLARAVRENGGVRAWRHRLHT
jgi:Fic family protein